MGNRFGTLQGRQAEFFNNEDEIYDRPKNLVMPLSVEASELEELYQWREALPSLKVRENEELRADPARNS